MLIQMKMILFLTLTSGSPSSESNEDDLPILNNKRVRGTPSWMINFEIGEGLSDEDDLNAVLMLIADDPLTYKETVKCKKWRDAMAVEIKSTEENKTWELIPLPERVKPIGVC